MEQTLKTSALARRLQQIEDLRDEIAAAGDKAQEMRRLPDDHVCANAAHWRVQPHLDRRERAPQAAVAPASGARRAVRDGRYFASH